MRTTYLVRIHDKISCAHKLLSHVHNIISRAHNIRTHNSIYLVHDMISWSIKLMSHVPWLVIFNLDLKINTPVSG